MPRSKYHLRAKRSKGRFVFFRKKNREVREVLKQVA